MFNCSYVTLTFQFGNNLATKRRKKNHFSKLLDTGTLYQVHNSKITRHAPIFLKIIVARQAGVHDHKRAPTPPVWMYCVFRFRGSCVLPHSKLDIVRAYDTVASPSCHATTAGTHLEELRHLAGIQHGSLLLRFQHRSGLHLSIDDRGVVQGGVAAPFAFQEHGILALLCVQWRDGLYLRLYSGDLPAPVGSEELQPLQAMWGVF